jgi:hypothetical protein
MFVFSPICVFPVSEVFGSKVKSCPPAMIHSVHFGSFVAEKDHQGVVMPFGSSIMYRFRDSGVYVGVNTCLEQCANKVFTSIMLAS